MSATKLASGHRRSSTSASSSLACRYSTQSPTPTSVVPSFAFAFDIDGVLLRSSQNLPGATIALQLLQKNNIPFILLTNGGGKHESARVEDLSLKFGINLTEQNFVQSHTPFKEMVDGSDDLAALKDKNILVMGGDQDKCRTIAEKYGFENVIIPADILVSEPAIWPFNQIWTDYYNKIARPLPSSPLKISAVFVFNDPRDWALDQQILLDLLSSSEGVLGTYSSKNGDTSLPNNGWQQDGQPSIIFSNPDLFWAASYHLPRLGQGGFRAAFDGLWKETTDGAELKKTVIGKPFARTYSYAERVLQGYRNTLLGGAETGVPKLDRVFMVGDNPESDIRGANDFKSPNGTEWTSILVKTGVYRDGTVPKYTPKVVVNDVLEAVTWALKQEGFKV